MAGNQTAFLSHSHLDSELAKGLQGFLQKHGWKVYIDWEDVTMPPKPTKATAKKIKDRIVQLQWFIYLATKNSADSRWCPWEIGYADGVKSHDKIVVVPTTDNDGKNYGNEYLDLYRHIDIAKGGGVGIFDPDTKRGPLLENLRP